MRSSDIRKLRRLTRFGDLITYLRDELDWPVEVEDAEKITFEYQPEELGLDPRHAVKIESIRQIRPLSADQPWGIFYIQFETKRLPVVVLRRILRRFVPASRKRGADQPVWRMSNLLFICAQGEADDRSISFAHFRQREGRVAELRTFSWDTHETHFYYIKNLNLEKLRWPSDDMDSDNWLEQWRQAFSVEHRYTITKSQELAREMARNAATTRDLVKEVYEVEPKDAPLHQLFRSFKEVLLHDLKTDAFADTVAQTVAYGLFSAAAQSDDLTYDRMVELIPNTNPFLRDLLAELTTHGAVDLEELGVEQLIGLLRQTDVEAILQDFGRQSGLGREDPVIHFYELFLSEYDKRQKVQRGVFYTPDPVVSYIVRSVDYLLKKEFGLEDGLAETSVDPKTGEPIIQILDPATGTGTFLAHVMDEIEKTVKAKPGVDWNTYVAEHLLPRLNGFELMMAPYAVAHMKLGLKLRQTGYDFASDERLRIYLTNTLEQPVEKHEALALAGFLSNESDAAARVKRQKPITVLIGNPPYSNFGRMNTGEWITDLIGDWKPSGERKWNPDDFMRFMRWAEWCLKKVDMGVLAFITNSSYVDGLTHRRMRKSLLDSFKKIYILDLHGSTQRRETAPGDVFDKNVFDIKQGVAIGIFIKSRERDRPTVVHHADLWGSRERKYRWLTEADVSTTEWTELANVHRASCLGNFYFFAPKAFNNIDEYCKGWSVTDDIFPLYNSGIQTGRDAFVSVTTQVEFDQWIKLLTDEDTPESVIRKKVKMPIWKGFDLQKLRRKLNTPSLRAKMLTEWLYRPFDVRPLIYDSTCIKRMRGEGMDQLRKPNLALITVRQLASDAEWKHAFVTDHMGDGNTISLKTREYNYYFPLYRYTSEMASETLFEDPEVSREPNLSPKFVNAVKQKLGLTFQFEGTGDLEHYFGPEDVLHYMYAVFHSPSYSRRYAELLSIEYPRLPMTSRLALFRKLVKLGADLVALHLLRDEYSAASWIQLGESSPLLKPITTFVQGANGTTMGRFSKATCYEDEKIYLDTSRRRNSSYFDSVPDKVWNFEIGGYQVCHKWLYDRRETPSQPGYTLTEEDIAHYQRIVVAIKETIRLMDEIDAVIETHGGWPIE